VRELDNMPLIGRAIMHIRSVEWKWSDARAAIVLGIIGTAVAAGGYVSDNFGLDDVIFTLIATAVGAGAFLYRSDLNRRQVRDSLAIAALAFAIYTAAHVFDLPPKVFQFAIDNMEYEVDDGIFVLFLMSVALCVYVYRRLQDLNHEVGARRTAEDMAQKLARHDPLTGLPNRRFFNEKLEEALNDIEHEDRRAAVLMLDLDGFKAINDVHGHQVGDQALIEFSERIGKAAKGALVARVGGDEFTIVLPKIATFDDPAALARRIIASVSEPFVIAGTGTTLGVGIGISIAPNDGVKSDDLMRRADLALYRAKSEGRSCTRFFEPAMDAHVERRSAIERELRAAIAANQIETHYQPLVELGGNRIIGFEALARWKSPVLGDVPPVTFIPIAEESGLIHRLGDQLLRTACHDAKSWPEQLTLAFNISPVQLRDATLGLRVLSILGETGLPPSRLELEVTESAIVGDGPLARQMIDELRAAGVRIALDDFGTGYATMSQLLSFRFDKIKIDRSFVEKLGDGGGSEVIVRAIIGLAKGLGLATTAEGIETAGQLADLKAEGCFEGQGYLFGKAVPANEVRALLRQPSIAKVA
jgi:diguanylate cyclase (GGDEF)-like protein